jgi:catechol 2,3-dioxygenase-like lactoylglutathione lyase family enzyme
MDPSGWLSGGIRPTDAEILRLHSDKVAAVVDDSRQFGQICAGTRRALAVRDRLYQPRSFRMSVAAMNHFTVLSDDLEATRRFYCDLFGFKVGWRPPFQFPGWWLYAEGEDRAILHVIQQNPLPKERVGVLDHMAFSAQDLPATIETLKREGIEYELRRLPGGGIWQLFFHDPHGAKVEFDFDKDEPAPAGYVAA